MVMLKFLTWLVNLISDRPTRSEGDIESAEDACLQVTSIASVFSIIKLQLVVCHPRFDLTHTIFHSANSTLNKVRCTWPLELCVISKSVVANRMTG